MDSIFNWKQLRITTLVWNICKFCSLCGTFDSFWHNWLYQRVSQRGSVFHKKVTWGMLKKINMVWLLLVVAKTFISHVNLFSSQSASRTCTSFLFSSDVICYDVLAFSPPARIYGIGHLLWCTLQQLLLAHHQLILTLLYFLQTNYHNIPFSQMSGENG